MNSSQKYSGRTEEFETTFVCTWPSLQKQSHTVLCKFYVLETRTCDRVKVISTEIGYRRDEDGQWRGIEAGWIWDIIPHVERARWDRQMLALWDKETAIYTDLGAEVA